MIVVDLGFAYFGLVIGPDGRVSRAAPIAKYAVGWSKWRAIQYFAARGKVVIRP